MKEDKHQNLLSEKGGSGFPHLVFMDSGGTVLTEAGDRSVAGFAQAAKQAQANLELKKKGDAGDEKAKYDFLLLEIGMRTVKASEARKRLGEIKSLTDDQKKRAEDLLVDLDVAETAETAGRDLKTRIEAGKKFAEMDKAGRVPKGDREFQAFYIFMMDYAESQKDAAMFEKAFGILKDKYGDRMNKKFRDTNEERLKKLKGGK
ncbi:MAG: hypothetical protein HYY17_01285 [Planctomycetes bacterium]|nr:hypothetical protein [Planctomycetota bacterium]